METANPADNSTQSLKKLRAKKQHAEESWVRDRGTQILFRKTIEINIEQILLRKTIEINTHVYS